MLRTWLNQAGVDSDQALNVLVAAGEALTNSIEHGHRHCSGNGERQTDEPGEDSRCQYPDNSRRRTAAAGSDAGGVEDGDDGRPPGAAR